jgi:hypothetical protein
VVLEGDVYFPDGTKIMGVAVDVSLSGGFISCDERFGVGTKCQALLATGKGPDAERLDIRGEVARVHDDGMALRFTDMPDDTYDLLCDLVMRHAPDQEQIRREMESRPDYRKNRPPSGS